VDFRHGLGASLFIAPATNSIDDNSAVAYGLSYFPSIKLADFGDNLRLRLAVSPSLGISGSVNSREGGSLSFLLDAPVDAELHFGVDEAEAFGGHVGVGFACNRMTSADFGQNRAFGPHFTAGLKAYIFNREFGLRASFLLNLNKKADDYGNDPKQVFGITLANYF